MNKRQIINLAVSTIAQKAVGITEAELSRIITKVADMVEAETKKSIEEKQDE